MATVSTQAPKIQKYIRGDSRQLNIQFYQSDGVTPFDLTGCEVFFTLNSSNAPVDNSLDSSAALQKSTTSFATPSNGLATITLANADTQSLAPGTYYYDIQLKDSAGNVTSLMSNTFEVVADITTRVT